MTKKELRCQVCVQEYDRKHQKKLGICPFCGTRLAPILIAQDGYVHISWQYLRILAIYATRWTQHFDVSKRGNRDAIQALANAVQHLTQYQPKGAEPLLIEETPETVEAISKVEIQETGHKRRDGAVPSPYFKKRT